MILKIDIVFELKKKLCSNPDSYREHKEIAKLHKEKHINVPQIKSYVLRLILKHFLNTIPNHPKCHHKVSDDKESSQNQKAFGLI